jgi:hypothetical protein
VRELADEERIRHFMQALGGAAREDGNCYLTGGATAVLLGWRSTTLDVDIKLEPEQDEVLRALPRIKEELAVNVELASPADFIPLPRAWRDRSLFVARERRLSFRHFDLYSQALAKLERGHAQDVDDVREMVARGLVEAARSAPPSARSSPSSTGSRPSMLPTFAGAWRSFWAPSGASGLTGNVRRLRPRSHGAVSTLALSKPRGVIITEALAGPLERPAIDEAHSPEETGSQTRVLRRTRHRPSSGMGERQPGPVWPGSLQEQRVATRRTSTRP